MHQPPKAASYNQHPYALGPGGRIKYFSAVFFFCCAVLLMQPFPGMALDFGLTVSQSPEYTNTTSNDREGTLDYTGSYSPWISGELESSGIAKLYLSAKLTTTREGGEWKYGSLPILFEIGRSEVSWRPASTVYLEAGRIPFQDPLGIIAAGLFDGAMGSVALGGKVRLTTGTFYTGLLYKETAKIVMTSRDAEQYTLSDTYFASRRILLSVGAEFPALTPRSSLVLNGLSQFDVNPKSDNEEFLHSQYLTAHYTMSLLDNLAMTGTGVFALRENQDDVIANFAIAAGIDWEAPGDWQDMIQGEIRWSSGRVNKNIGAFMPVTSIAQGEVFSPPLSALMPIKGKYTVRFLKTFSSSLEGTYFIRTDGETMAGTGYAPSSSRFLGGELYGSLVWAPTSDIAVTAGAGVFFPGLGNVFDSDAPNLWKFAMGVILSF
jgi:hypothetical protein